MAFVIDIFQFHCKIELKQLKRKEIKRNMFKSDNIFCNLQSSAVFQWLLKSQK